MQWLATAYDNKWQLMMTLSIWSQLVADSLITLAGYDYTYLEYQQYRPNFSTMVG